MNKTNLAIVETPAAEEIPWSQAPVEARKKVLGNIFVERDIEKRIIQLIESARSDCNIYPEAQNVVITGETGVGKSEILKRYLAANPERIDPVTGNVVRPVLYVSVAVTSTPKSVAQSMYHALLNREGIDDPTDAENEDLRNGDGADPEEEDDKKPYLSGGTAEITAKVKRQMVGQGVRVALLDEFHNTISDNGESRLNKVAEWVRDFAKSKNRSSAIPHGKAEENIVMVLVGVRKVKNVIDATVNPELASITPYRIEIDRYRYGTDEEKRAFRAFLDELDIDLPFDEDSRLGQPLLADKLHIATFGLLRQLGHIVLKAAEIAIDDGSPHIKEHHLHQAVELKRGVLEAALMSEESTGPDRRVVENPFNPPLLPDTREQKRRGGFRG